MGFRWHSCRQQQQINWVTQAELHVDCICTHTSSIDQATERRLHFDSPTRTRGNSDLCVHDCYCLRVWIRRLWPIFPLSQVELCLGVRARWLESGQFRSSISLPGNHADLLSQSTSTLSTLWAALALWLLLGEKETSQTDKTQNFFAHNRRSVSPLCPACVRAVDRGQCDRSTGRAATSLATESTGTVLTPRQKSEIAGHGFFSILYKCWFKKELFESAFPF